MPPTTPVCAEWVWKQRLDKSSVPRIEEIFGLQFQILTGDRLNFLGAKKSTFKKKLFHFTSGGFGP